MKESEKIYYTKCFEGDWNNIEKNFVVPFYGWGSTVSRLQSHSVGDSLIFTTRFQVLPGTHLINLG